MARSDTPWRTMLRATVPPKQNPITAMTVAPDSVVLTNKRFIIYRPKFLGGAQFEDYIWRDLGEAITRHDPILATMAGVLRVMATPLRPWTGSFAHRPGRWLPGPWTRRGHPVAGMPTPRRLTTAERCAPLRS